MYVYERDVKCFFFIKNNITLWNEWILYEYLILLRFTDLRQIADV